MSNFLPIFSWWLMVEILGLIGLPLTLSVFNRLPDRGYLLSKTIGILLISFLTWLLVSGGIFPYQPTSILVAGFLIALVSVGFLWKEKNNLVNFFRQNLKLILVGEILFLFTFLFYLIIRMYNPEIYWGEKPMDFSILNVLLRTRSLPPPDPWFSGTLLNYYYFGQFIVATLTKLCGLSPNLTFNLANALIPALVVGAAFSLLYNLTQSYRYALWGGLFAGFLGNLDSLRQFFFLHRPINFDSFWATSRVIPDYLIEEYPLWSFLFADLHAHVIAMPLALLVLCLAYNILYREKSGGWEWATNLSLLAVSLGALLLTNSWDYPTFSVLLLGVFVIQGCFARKKLLSLLKNIGGFSLILILSILFYFPFYLNFKTQGVGYGLVKEGWTTQIHHLLLLFGFFIFLVFSFLIFSLIKKRLQNQIKTREMTLIITSLVVVIGAFYFFFYILKLGHGVEGLMGLLAILALMAILLNRDSPDKVFALWLFLFTTIIILGAELFYFDCRMNTVFKLYLPAWFFLAISAAYSLYIVRKEYFPFLPKFKFFWEGIFWLLLLGSLFGTVTNVYAMVNTHRVRQIKPTLDGFAYLEFKDKNEYEAINWLNQNVAGTPTLLEAQGPEYQDYSRISMNTGLPTVLGWEHHSSQKGHPREKIQERKKDIAALYNTPHLKEAQELLSKYMVSYIYIGNLEKRTYLTEGLEKFDRLNDLKVVYKNSGVKIYSRILENNAGYKN